SAQTAAPTTAAKPASSPAANPDESRPLSPAVRRLVAENEIDPSSVPATGKGGRLTKGDVVAFLEKAPAAPAETSRQGAGDRAPEAPITAPAPAPPASNGQRETRERLSSLRQRIAQRLVEVQQTAAILTTFNEADLSRVIALRTRYKDAFQKKH